MALVLLVSVSNGATKTWNGGTGAGKNWTTPGNWNPVGAPVGGDDIIFNTAGSITFSTLPASVSYNSITISAGTIVLVGTNMTFTVGGAVGTDFTIASGASVTLTNASITLANNATADISGTMNIGTGRTYNTNGTGVVSTVTGTIGNTGTVTCTTASKLLMQSGSTYTHS